MDILKLIKKDYATVKTLFKRLEARSELTGDETSRLVNELITEFLLHAKAKEKALYRPLRSRSEKLRDFTMRAHVKNKLLEIALKRLTVLTPKPQGEFRAVLRVAREHFREHTVQEEKLFRGFERAFSAEEREQLGSRFKTVKDELRAKRDGTTQVEDPADASGGLVRSESTNEGENPTVMDLPGSAPYAGDEAVRADDNDVISARDLGDRQGGAAIGPEGVIQAIRPESANSPGAAGAVPSHHPELVPSAVVPAPSAGAADEQPAPGEAPRSEQLKRAV